MKNLIFLVIDGFRNDYMNKTITPNLYKLSQQGLTFEKAYALGPWSPPAIKGFFTSTYPLMYDESISISPLTITLAEVLKNNGYKTAGFTLGGWISPFFNFDRGFDNFVWTIEETEQKKKNKFFIKIKRKISKILPNLRKIHRLLFLIKNTGKGRLEIDRLLLKKVLSWIEQNKSNNFFVYIHLEGPHEPYLEGSSRLKLIKANYNLLKTKNQLKTKDVETIRNLYRFAVTETDNYVNQFIEELKSTGVLNDTCLVICSDHGKQLYEKDVFGHTPDFYESNIRVPLIILGKDIKSEKISRRISFLDLAPTILDILKLKQPMGFFGKSIFKYKREFFFCEDSRQGDNTLFPDITNLKFNLENQGIAVINENYKYIHKKNGEDELFNLSKDPEENKNIINSDKKTAKILKKLIIGQLEFEERTRQKSPDIT